MSLKCMDMNHKIVSSANINPLNFDPSVNELLGEALRTIDTRFSGISVPIDENSRDAFIKLRALVGQAIIKSELPRSRSSSQTSTGSLGDRLAVRDKEDYLYTYPWVNRNSGAENDQPNAVWARGNSFRAWAEHPHRRLPLPKSALNCWEAVSVLLYMYHAVTKQDIRTAY